MPAFFDPGGVNAVVADLFGVQRVADGADLMEHLYARFFQGLDRLGSAHLIDGASGDLDARHPLLGADAEVHGMVLRRDPQ